MSEKRTEALLVTSLPPLETGLATYAIRVIENTVNFIEWTVAYTSGSDPESLPGNVKSMPIEEMEECNVPNIRIFQIGNSADCFPVARALYKLGGTVVFHEIVFHHMLRYSYLEKNEIDEYKRELIFCLGPAAGKVEKDLSGKNTSVSEFDTKLKQYPLAGRILNSASSAVCLNSFALSKLERTFPEGKIIRIGHPLSKLPDIQIPLRPYKICFGMIGSNHPGRNLEKVIESVKLLRNDLPDSGLVLVGSGYPEDLPEWVTNAGRLDEKEYQGWIRTLDYLFDVRYPTCGETSGSLLEAMRAGIPSIVTATGSFNNIPSDAVIRVLPDNIVQGIRSAVLLLEDRPEIKRSISENAALYAEDTGSVERLVNDWKRVMVMAAQPLMDNFPVINAASLSPAWHEPPEGFVRDLNTMPVTWRFSGKAMIEGPENASGALVTAWGEGSLNSINLQSMASVTNVDGRVLHFRGNGRVSDVFWK